MDARMLALQNDIEDAVESFSGAVWVNYPNQRPSSVNDNGTCGFVDTGERKLLITAHHVVQEFRRQKAENPAARFAVNLGGVSIPLDDLIVLSEDEHLDVAIVAFPELDQIPRHAKQYFRISWPMAAAVRGDAIAVVGFPGNRRRANESVGYFEPVPLAFGATCVSDRNIILADESRTRRMTRRGVEVNEPLYAGGFSGSPGFAVREDGLHLVGVFRAGPETPEGSMTDALYLSRIDYLRPDGTLDRGRMPW